MSNEGFLKFIRNETQKDLVTVIQEETVDKVNQSQIADMFSTWKNKLSLAKVGI